MPSNQIALLQRLIEADRRYRSAKHADLPTSNADRGIEIGAINGVDPRTARALEEAGLAESVAGLSGHPYLYLGRYAPHDAGHGPG